ncbi:MAG: peroxiredoxin [Aestuariivita sp.]|nr:peroxiredoxin [Aestuariivita sp.]
MTICPGNLLPEATLMAIGENGPEPVSLAEKTKDRKIVLFGLPGAYTSTCTATHLPSIIRNIDKFKTKGVDEVICVSVNDPFVVKAWAESTGAEDAGITMVSDPSSAFTKSLDLAFNKPEIGFFNRSKRYAMLVENNKILLFHLEKEVSICDITGAEKLLKEI